MEGCTKYAVRFQHGVSCHAAVGAAEHTRAMPVLEAFIPQAAIGRLFISRDALCICLVGSRHMSRNRKWNGRNFSKIKILLAIKLTSLFELSATRINLISSQFVELIPRHSFECSFACILSSYQRASNSAFRPDYVNHIKGCCNGATPNFDKLQSNYGKGSKTGLLVPALIHIKQ